MDVPTILDVFVGYGFETDDELTDARKLEALNETYWDACAREAWPFLEKSFDLTYGGSSGVASNDPADYNSVSAVFRVSDGWVLQPWRTDDFYQRFGDALTQTGSPQLYFFEGGTLHVYPTPATTDTVRIKYVKVPAELIATSAEADIVLPKRYHRSVLVMGTLAKLAMFQDDPEMAAQYDALYQRALAQMVEDQLKQQTDRPDYIHVSDWDNFDYS